LCLEKTKLEVTKYMRLFKVTTVLLVLILAALIIIPIVSAAPDTKNHEGADKDDVTHGDECKDWPNQDSHNGMDNDNSDYDGKNHDKDKKCDEYKKNVSFKNTSVAAKDLVSTISSQSTDFADWNGATVTLDTTYYDMSGMNASYSYDVMKDGQYTGYVIVSASRDNYPILEFSRGITPDKNITILAKAKQLAESRIKTPRQILGEGQPLYLGATFFYMAYPVQMNHTRYQPQQISRDWIFVDLIDGNIVNTTVVQLNATEREEQRQRQQQRVAQAHAAWDTIENEASTSPVLLPAVASSKQGTTSAVSQDVQASSSNLAVVIGGVPAYYWKYGCSPTAAAMVMGYWKNRGLTPLPAVTDTGVGDPLNRDLATAMGTHVCGDGSWWWAYLDQEHCGRTSPGSISIGIHSVFEQSGIKQSGWRVYNYKDLSFDTDATELDNGYPFILSMWSGGASEGSSETYGEHSVAVIGYNRVYSDNPILIIYDTWDTEEHYIAYNNWAFAMGDRVENVREFTITAEAGEGGSVTPGGKVSVLPYFTPTYTIAPDPGYVIDNVVIDTINNKGAIATYTFDPVWRNHIISATFTPSVCSMLTFTDANFKTDAVQYFNSNNTIPAGNYTLNVTGWNSQWSYDMGWWEEGVTTQASKSAAWRNMTNLWVEGETTPLSTIVTGEFARENSWGSASVNISSPSRVGIVLVDNPYYDNRGAATFVLKNADQTCPATMMKQSMNELPSIAADENGIITNETFVETKN
jgi:hypothetical protein